MGHPGIPVSKRGIIHAESETETLPETHLDAAGARCASQALAFGVSELPRKKDAASCLPEVRVLQGAGSRGSRGSQLTDSSRLHAKRHSSGCDGFGSRPTAGN